MRPVGRALRRGKSGESADKEKADPTQLHALKDRLAFFAFRKKATVSALLFTGAREGGTPLDLRERDCYRMAWTPSARCTWRRIKPGPGGDSPKRKLEKMEQQPDLDFGQIAHVSGQPLPGLVMEMRFAEAVSGPVNGMRRAFYQAQDFFGIFGLSGGSLLYWSKIAR
jgi:hypothetical protein